MAAHANRGLYLVTQRSWSALQVSETVQVQTRHVEQLSDLCDPALGWLTWLFTLRILILAPGSPLLDAGRKGSPARPAVDTSTWVCTLELQSPLQTLE